MLDFIYYPVSGILWLWCKVFGFVFGDTGWGGGFAWALSVMFLVFTLRAILYKPFVSADPHHAPDAGAAATDREALQEVRQGPAEEGAEMQKLQKEHGFNPMLGCLPMLVQLPVFIGLFHVLRSFNRTWPTARRAPRTTSSTRRASTRSTTPVSSARSSARG